ncbi:hypothetical protein PG996_004752 [Apiospora saccharicola]|uniref:Cyanovirin-N domain-containing protein n=1 Tax=Apiospora saccharicola TaxID=335842 RepID=A0ABR1W580_9PEZI
MIAASILLALISATGLASADDDPRIWEDCPDVRLWSPGTSNWYLNASCWNKVNQLLCSHMALDSYVFEPPSLLSARELAKEGGTDNSGSCYTDINGQIQPSGNGEGIRNCQNCSLDGSNLHCQCLDSAGNYQDSYADLSKSINHTIMPDTQNKENNKLGSGLC